MSDTISVLLQEHRNISRVLELVRRQTENMASHAPVNFRLLEGCFEYLSSYPEKCHHPKEDLVYRKVCGRAPDIVELLKDLVDEHERLAHFTRNLRHSIAAAGNQPSAVSVQMVETLQNYLDAYRMHMETEEVRFFPLVLARLSRDDLAEIDFTLFDQPDHPFDREAEARLTELHRAIAQTGKVEDSNADHRQEAAWLAALHDIAAFNKAMERAGDPVSLTQSSDDGYDLFHRGKLLLRIPACSQARAAWCAYYYRKATKQPDKGFTLDGMR